MMDSNGPGTAVEVHAPATLASAPATALNPLTLGKLLAESGYFKDAQQVAQAAVKVLAGQELGIGPVASMTGIDIIEGKPSISAGVLAGLVKASPKYNYRPIRWDNEACELVFFEGGKRLEPTSVFTLEDAKRADIGGKGNWRKYPRNMLFARALSNGVRLHCPDVTRGPMYTPDELGVEVDDMGQSLSAPVIEIDPTQPYGEPMAPNEAGSTAEALAFLLSDAPTEPTSAADVGLAEKVWLQLEKDAGGYMPWIVARVIKVTKAALKAKLEGEAGALSVASEVISSAQLTRLCVVWANTGAPDAELRRVLKDVAGVESRKDIPRDRYDDVVATIERLGPADASKSDVPPDTAGL